MSDYFIELPSAASPRWKSPVASAADLPATGNTQGDVRQTLDTKTLYTWDGVSSWIAMATPGAAIALDGLIGEVTATGPGVAVATVSNAAVIAKVLTGYTPTVGTITSSDSILLAIEKLDGNISSLAPGGSIYSIQYNNGSGGFGGDTNFTYDGSTISADVSGNITFDTSAGSVHLQTATAQFNMGSSGGTALLAGAGSSNFQILSDSSIKMTGNGSTFIANADGTADISSGSAASVVIGGIPLIVSDSITGVTINDSASNESANFTTRQLIDDNGTYSIRWGDRIANDEIGNDAIYWGQSARALLNDFGNLRLLFSDVLTAFPDQFNGSDPTTAFKVQGGNLVVNDGNIGDPFNANILVFGAGTNIINTGADHYIASVRTDTGNGSAINLNSSESGFISVIANSGSVFTSNAGFLAAFADLQNGATMTINGDNSVSAVNLNTSGSSFTSSGNGVLNAIFENGSGNNSIGTSGAGAVTGVAISSGSGHNVDLGSNGAAVFLAISGGSNSSINNSEGSLIAGIYAGGDGTGTTSFSTDRGGWAGGYLESDGCHVQANNAAIAFGRLSGANSFVEANGEGSICGASTDGSSGYAHTEGEGTHCWVRLDGDASEAHCDGDGSSLFAYINNGALAWTNDQGTSIVGNFQDSGTVAKTSAPGSGIHAYMSGGSTLTLQGSGQHAFGDMESGSSLTINGPGSFWAGAFLNGTTNSISANATTAFLNDNTGNASNIIQDYCFAAGSGLNTNGGHAFLFGEDYTANSGYEFDIGWGGTIYASFSRDNGSYILSAGGNNKLTVTNESTPIGPYNFGTGVNMVLGGVNYADFDENGNLILTNNTSVPYIQDYGNNNLIMAISNDATGLISTSGQESSIVSAQVSEGGQVIIGASNNLTFAYVDNAEVSNNSSQAILLASNYSPSGLMQQEGGNSIMAGLDQGTAANGITNQTFGGALFFNLDDGAGGNTVSTGGTASINALYMNGATESFTTTNTAGIVAAFMQNPSTSISVSGNGSSAFLSDNTGNSSNISGTGAFAVGSGLTIGDDFIYLFGTDYSTSDDHSFNVAWSGNRIFKASQSGGVTIWDSSGNPSGDFQNRALDNGAGTAVLTWATRLNSNLSKYASDAAAGVAGLVAGDFYQTSGTGTGVFATPGVVMVKQ